MLSFGKLSEQEQRNYDLANIYLDRDDYENAVKYFNIVLKTNPGNKQILESLQKVKDKIKSQRRAIDTTKTMILYTSKNLNVDLLNWYYENNYVVFSVGYGNNSWAVCFLKNLEKIEQKVSITPKIPEQFIEQGWNDGYYITHACYGLNAWLIVTQSIKGVGKQQWFFNSDFPEEEVEALYREGYQISVCDYGEAWLVVMDENSFFADQDYTFYDEYPEDQFETLWEEDRYVTRLLYTGENWLLIHSTCEMWNVQGLFNRARFPFAELEKEFDEEASVPTSISHDGVDWNIIYTSLSDSEDEESLDEDELKNFTIEQALLELGALVGLSNVKEEINNLISLINLNKIKQTRGLNIMPIALHMVFTGNPGTGKTTVARIIGKILRAIGMLKKGHLVEVDRSGLVAEYVGQTAVKTNKAIDDAMDGVLFIDEAYALAKGDTDFGQEAIETLLKRMEDNRDRFVVIIAGYTDEMKNFIQSNPGLKSRFNTYLHFNDYNAEELMDIYRRLFIKAEHQLSSDADEFSMKYFQFLMRSKDKYFGNARDIRNLLEDIIKIQSSRLAQVTDISDEQLRTVNKEDVQLAVKDNYEEEHEITLEDVLQELNNLVGLTEIKKEVSNLTDFIKVEQMRKLKGLPSKPISLHSVFYGPPGTGKTTVARLLGKIFKTLRLLPKGEVKEVSRADLVAEYIGQTAIKTNKVIDDAFNGVLFLDEAYSLSDNKTGSDFGKEAIETLLKRMEDDRSHLCVIIAGYTDKMKQFIDSNPGLRSRFTNYFFFENYSADELLKIIIGFMESEKYILEPGGESLLTQQFENWIYTADENFGNARDARNLFEKIKVQQSKRLNRMENPSTDDLSLLKKVDIQASTDNDKTF